MVHFINILTLLRFVLAIIIFCLIVITNNFILALMLFFIAGITDYFDGYLARKYDAESELGEILDPIADKILIIFCLFALAIELDSTLISFFGALIISREIWVSSLRDINARKNNVDATKVTFIAKTKTSIQLFTVLIYLIALGFNNMLLVIFGDIFLTISLIITLYSGYIYTLNTFKN